MFILVYIWPWFTLGGADDDDEEEDDDDDANKQDCLLHHGYIIDSPLKHITT